MSVNAARVRVYLDEAGEWRWQARDTNGEPVADSGEGYADKGYAIGAAQALFPGAELEVLTSDGEVMPLSPEPGQS